MPEMADSGENHCHLAFIRRGNNLRVADGTTRLDGGRRAGLRRSN